MNRRQKEKRDKFRELRRRVFGCAYSEMRQINRQYHELMIEFKRYKREQKKRKEPASGRGKGIPGF